MTTPKRLLLTAAAAIAFTLSISAANTKETTSQVTSTVTLSTDVDYHITGTTPFADNGKVDITNTEHAVLILDKVRPSVALTLLEHITINGEAAVDDVNCQVRIYDRGSIILPYGGSSFRPLTVFDGDDFEGESYNTLTEGHNGNGYMKDIPSAWNNRIRSFKLKRGYMVTFALQKAGRGYSRCFIAADADLNMTLPPLMASRITSYRIFKWYNTSKVGVSDMNAEGLAKLNAQSTFGWGPGGNMLPDVECVPHHIDESWPSPAECGRASYSPHMKANNEPRNEADHGTWTMEQILNNWENMMATGMRLCTPSSWDGSDYGNATGFLADFLTEIDNRGWRCDIIDLHGYWNSGSFTSNVNNWAQKFNRPVWITEWVWGSSWGNNGIFGEASSRDNPTAADLQRNKEVVSSILNNLNSNNACERYFYWNGEANCSKLLRDGQLTPAGEYFATMRTNGPGYTNYGNYIPKSPPYTEPTILTVTNNLKKGINTITFKNVSGELTDTLVLQRRMGSTGAWIALDSWGASDKEDYEYVDSISEPGLYSYRVRCIGYDAPKKWLSSNIESVTVGGSYNIGDIMYGRIQVSNDQAVTVSFPSQESKPYIIMGLPTRANQNAAFATQVMTVGSDNFKFIYRPWAYGVTNNEISRVESSDFIVMQPGNYTWGNMKAEVGTYHKEGSTETMMKDEVEVVFNQPFDEGVIPIVLAQNQGSSTNGPVVTTQVYDVTNTGFKVKLQAQSANTVSVRTMYIRYIAITPGQAKLEGYKKVLNAGFGDVLVGGETNTRGQLITFFDAKGDTLNLLNPYIIAGPQTHNLDYSCIFRKYSNITKKVPDAAGNNIEYQNGMRVSRQMDPSVRYATGTNTADVDGDVIGWFAISDDPDAEDAIRPVTLDKPFNVRVVGRSILPSDINARIYTASGTQVAVGKSLPTGIYMVTNGSHTVKVMIR